MRVLRILALTLAEFIVAVGIASGQSWQPLTHQPSFSPGAVLLLTDGTVLAHSEPNCLSCTSTDYSSWYKLTPDSNGSYVDGTWSKLASSATVRWMWCTTAACCDRCGLIRASAIGGVL